MGGVFGRSWKLVLRQTGYPLPNAQDWRRHNPDDDTSENFSILDELERCKQDSKWTFKLTFPDNPNLPDSTLSNVWSQRSNPLSSGPIPEGYDPIDVAFPGMDFNGLTNGAVNGFSNSLLCNDCVDFSWYFAVGCVDTGPCAHPTQYPGPCTATDCYCTGSTELWVDCPLRWGIFFLSALGFFTVFYLALGIFVGVRAGRRDRRGSVSQLGWLAPSNGLGAVRAHPHFRTWSNFSGLVRDGVWFALAGKAKPPDEAGGTTSGVSVGGSIGKPPAHTLGVPPPPPAMDPAREHGSGKKAGKSSRGAETKHSRGSRSASKSKGSKTKAAAAAENKRAGRSSSRHKPQKKSKAHKDGKTQLLADMRYGSAGELSATAAATEGWQSVVAERGDLREHDGEWGGHSSMARVVVDSRPKRELDPRHHAYM